MKNRNERKCYALHILPDNPMEKLMTEEIKDIIEEHSIGITPTPYDLLVLFTDEIDRIECGKKLEAKGIKIAYELVPVYVDKKYIERDVE